jgi:secreted trypsin-like serine protease
MTRIKVLQVGFLAVISLSATSCARQPSEQQLQQTRHELSRIRPLGSPVSIPRTHEILEAQRNAQAYLFKAQNPAERTIAKEVLDRFGRQLEVQSQVSATESYIINGKPARPGQFPYQAALVFTGYENAFDGQYCSGTLIEPQWVLTAGHCVTKTMSPGDIQILVNVLKLSTGTRRLDLAKVCRHPQYKITGPHAENDIALIKLATPVAGVSTIKIPNANIEPMMFQFTRNATISGWGDTGSGNHAGSDDLLFGTVRVIDNRLCTKSYPHGQIVDGMVCATDQFTNTCRGDSGGPMIMRTADGIEYVEGVTSWGDKNCALGNPSVYTRISVYAPWIQTNLTSTPDCETQTAE